MGGQACSSHLQIALVVHGAKLRERVHDDVRFVGEVRDDDGGGGRVLVVSGVGRGPVQAEVLEVVLHGDHALEELPGVGDAEPAVDDVVDVVGRSVLAEVTVEDDGRHAQDEPPHVQRVEHVVRGGAHVLAKGEVLFCYVRRHPERHAGQGALPSCPALGPFVGVV
eukprot:1192414-Prorocentrum_minimum.AAC.2